MKFVLFLMRLLRSLFWCFVPQACLGPQDSATKETVAKANKTRIILPVMMRWSDLIM